MACKNKELTPGSVHVWREEITGLRIVNLPTKNHWRGKSRYEWVESGLKAMKEELIGWGRCTVVVPALGCGLGGLEWRRVEALIQQKLAGLDCTVVLIPPRGPGI